MSSSSNARRPSIAVIGASVDRSKWSNKAVRYYAQDGWQVYPVNPKYQEVEGWPAYASILDVPDPIDRVVLYVPPAVALQVLDDVARKRVGELIISPGADAPEVIEKARKLGLEPVVGCSVRMLRAERLRRRHQRRAGK